MRLPRPLAAVTLAAALAAVGTTPAADGPAGNGKLTPEQKEKLKNLTPEQREKLRAKFKARQGEKAPPPAAPVPKAPPTKPTATTAPKPVGEVVARIDAGIAARLDAERVPVSPPAADGEFARRVYLDLTGVIPTGDQAKAYLASADPDKKAKLIDELLASDNFGRHLADIWQAKLLPRTSDNNTVDRGPFTRWLAGRFNAGAGWDAITTEILTATGDVSDHPGATFFVANRAVDKLADAVGTHFLGVQITCAQCHNHPFTDWKQTEYWGLAAFFGKVQPRKPANPNKAGDDPYRGGVTELVTASRAKDFFPESTKKVPPKFLGGDTPKLTAAEPYRPALAAWLTGGGTPYFAQAFVNRAWAQLFARGLVNPVDDLDPDHQPTHPEVFDALAAQFRATKYDIKSLYRTLALTAAYGRTSKPEPSNTADTTLYGHMPVKVLSPGQLFDSLTAVVPLPTATGPAAKGDKKAFAQAFGKVPVTPRDLFVQFYLAGADTPNAAEYEAGIPQALKLMNGRLVNNPKAALAFAPSGAEPAAVFDAMYLATLTRHPTAAELAKLTAYHAKTGPPAAYTDALWALLNSSEFALVR